MEWDINEAAAYYKKRGAAGDQTELVSLLKEIQEESGGRLSKESIALVSKELGLKESYLMALIKRIPSLKAENVHVLEICAGPVCSKGSDLAGFVEKTYGKNPEKFTCKRVNCMRMCGKGPNIRLDGELYNKADEALLKQLIGKLK